MVLISVVMPVYNENNIELRQSIHSILNQSLHDFELIIVNDNPESIRIRKILNGVSKNDPIVKILTNSKSIGPSRSANRGIYEAQGKFIARMDADDICRENRLRSQLTFVKKYNLDLICSNFYGFNKEYLNKNPYYGNKDLVNQNRIKCILKHFNIAMGPTLFFKKDLFQNIGGYRDILGEDYDLIVRFIINKYRVGYQSFPILYKRNRINNLSNELNLNEFIINIIISQHLRVYGYNKIVPYKYIKKHVASIKLKDVTKYKKFQYYFNKFKKKKKLIYLLKCIIYTISSKLIFKRNLFILFINNKYKNKI